MIKPIGTAPINHKLFCQQYWERITNSVQNAAKNTSVAMHSDLFEINKELLRSYKPIQFVSTGTKRMIADSDRNFKLLNPLAEDIVLWRGITAPNYKNPNAIRAFDQAAKVQKGDIVHMPEYAFASTERKTAELYAPKDKRGIIYEIEVPKGARISHSFNYIFPRYSVFECLDTEIIPNGIFPNKLVKLRYILPEKFFGKS